MSQALGGVEGGRINVIKTDLAHALCPPVYLSAGEGSGSILAQIIAYVPVIVKREKCRAPSWPPPPCKVSASSKKSGPGGEPAVHSL